MHHYMQMDGIACAAPEGSASAHVSNQNRICSRVDRAATSGLLLQFVSFRKVSPRLMHAAYAISSKARLDGRLKHI